MNTIVFSTFFLLLSIQLSAQAEPVDFWENLGAVRAEIEADGISFQKTIREAAKGPCFSDSTNKVLYEQVGDFENGVFQAALNKVDVVTANSAIEMKGTGEACITYQEVTKAIAEKREFVEQRQAELPALEEKQKKLMQAVQKLVTSPARSPNADCAARAGALQAGVLRQSTRIAAGIKNISRAFESKKLQLEAYARKISALSVNCEIAKDSDGNSLKILKSKAAGAGSAIPAPTKAGKAPNKGNTITGLEEDKEKRLKNQTPVQAPTK